MDPHSFVYSAVLLLVVASVAMAVFRHFGLGSILGLLVTGIIVGPHTPGPFVTREVESVRHFAELGVVLLLFLIGLEMKPRRLWEMRRVIFGLGSLQVILCTLGIAAYFMVRSSPWQIGMLLGAGFALSSTAFVMQMLREQGDMASPHGQTAFAVLLMQDIAVVPMLALLPLLADSSRLPQQASSLMQIGNALAMLALVIVAGRYLVPRVLNYLASRNNREGFLLAAMAAMFAAAMAMDRAGMSMAMGAFLMGMMLSTSRYSIQIEAALEPHKGLLMSLFFVAVGMSVDVSVFVNRPWELGMDVLAIVSIKILILYGLVLAFGKGQSTALRVSFLLSQGGEFGFVVFGAAKAIGVINEETFVMAVAVISLTMLITPVLSRVGHWLALRSIDKSDQQAIGITAIERHVKVVIAGYGRVGHTVGTILSHSGIPYIAFDTDAAIVAKWHREGHPVYYGDISSPGLLGSPSLNEVDLVVLTIDDGPKAVKAAALIRATEPNIRIIARARDLATCDALYQVGVKEALPETLEASLRLAAESLEALGISTNETDLLLRGVRGAGYALVRTPREVGQAQANDG